MSRKKMLLKQQLRGFRPSQGNNPALAAMLAGSQLAAPGAAPVMAPGTPATPFLGKLGKRYAMFRRPIANTMAPAGAQDPKFGWIGPILQQMTATRRHVMSINPNNQVITSNTFPLVLMHATPADTLAAARTAVAGKAEKITATGAWAGADLSLTLTGTTSFGARVRVASSINSFKFPVVQVQILSGANVINQFQISANQLPVDVIVLAISNSNGQASIVGVTDLIVKFTLAGNPGLTAGDNLFAESLNNRDLGDVSGLNQCGCPTPVGDIAYDDGMYDGNMY